MKRILLELTEPTAKAVDRACRKSGLSRNAQIEDWLWRIGDVKAAAKSLKIAKPTRPKWGRPKRP